MFRLLTRWTLMNPCFEPSPQTRFEFRCATTLHLVTAAGQHIPRLLELGMQQHNHGTAGK